MQRRLAHTLAALISMTVLLALLMGSVPSSAFAERLDPFDGERAVQRAKTWTSRHVPYSQKKQFEGYRRDCSGFVSMAWDLPENLVTWRIPLVAKRIGKSELRAGDVLLDHTSGNRHVVIFERWANAERTKYVALEQTGQKGVNRAVRRTVPYPYRVNKGHYKPYRYVGMDYYWEAMRERDRQRVRRYSGPEVTPEIREAEAAEAAEKRAADKAERLREEAVRAAAEARQRVQKAQTAGRGDGSAASALATRATSAGETVGKMVVSLAEGMFSPAVVAAGAREGLPAGRPEGAAADKAQSGARGADAASAASSPVGAAGGE